jgi:hypothetical protein
MEKFHLLLSMRSWLLAIFAVKTADILASTRMKAVQVWNQRQR